MEIFIKNNFDGDIYKAFIKLSHPVMKADLWRYCIIYKYGGIYADTDTVCKIDPKYLVTDSLLTVVSENHLGFCQWFFYAPLNSPILKQIIDLSVYRILNEPMKGHGIIHYMTGPAVFTDGIIMYLKSQNLPIFENRLDFHKEYYDSNILRVLPTDITHKDLVVHLFAGSDEDGWKAARDKLFENGVF